MHSILAGAGSTSAPAPALQCNTNGGQLTWLETEAGASFRGVGVSGQKVAVELSAKNGSNSLLVFRFLAAGYTSSTYTASTPEYPEGLVLKVLSKDSFIPMQVVAREACVLRRLQWTAWAPRLLCSDDSRSLITTHAGERLVSHNVPTDAASQARAILLDMHSAGVAHNDVRK